MRLEPLRETDNKREQKKSLPRSKRKQKETSQYLIILENNPVKSEHREGEEKEGKLEHVKLKY